jgi:hypothetical protein
MRNLHQVLGITTVLNKMRLSSKKRGAFNAYYYDNPTVFHTYKLNGRTAAHKLNWMFKHITERRPDLNKRDLKMVVYDDGGIRMINRKTGGRMYTWKTGSTYLWHEEAPIDISTIHEDYGYNQ